MKISVNVHREGTDDPEIPDLFDKEAVLFKACWLAGRSLNPFVAEWVEVLQIRFPVEAGLCRNPEVWKFEIHAVLKNPLKPNETRTVQLFQKYNRDLAGLRSSDISGKLAERIREGLRDFVRTALHDAENVRSKIEFIKKD